jgi:hypothetical protein
MGAAFDIAGVGTYPHVPEDPHPEQELPPALKSTAHDKRNPISTKSTLMGLTFSMKSLSTIYWKPSMSNTSSVSFGSSRANAREGPPQPPELRKTRMGEASLPLKYSATCSVADGVTSIMRLILLG